MMFLLFIVQRKTPKDAAWKTSFFAMLFLVNEEQPSKKKLRSNVS